MHVDMWHTVIQSIVVLELSPKNVRPYPNTLLIRSLPKVDCWVFHPRDLTPFLIRLSWAFTCHRYFIFLSFPFHATLQQIFIFSSYNDDAYEM